MHPELYDIMPDGCDEEDNTQQQQQQQKLPRHAAVDIHYCGQSRLLSVVFADGSAALYSPPGTGYLQPQLTFRRWLCTAAARYAKTWGTGCLGAYVATRGGWEAGPAA